MIALDKEIKQMLVNTLKYLHTTNKLHLLRTADFGPLTKFLAVLSICCFAKGSQFLPCLQICPYKCALLTELSISLVKYNNVG